MTIYESFILGIVEGVTEFLPISSTGHLILAEHLLHLEETPAVKTFTVAIQLGAILAVLVLYWRYLLGRVLSARTSSLSRTFFVNIFLSFLPAAVIGLLLHSWITEKLFSPYWVIAALIVGGVIMIVLEGLLVSKRRLIKTIDDLGTKDALIIGFAQCASLWPGFSRAMATILGGRYVGLDAKDASEYSFFLALPTLTAATFFVMWKAVRHGDVLQYDHSWWVALAVAMLVSFVVAAIVIKAFLAFLRKYPLAWFGYYRIVLAVIFYILLKQTL